MQRLRHCGSPIAQAVQELLLEDDWLAAQESFLDPFILAAMATAGLRAPGKTEAWGC